MLVFNYTAWPYRSGFFVVLGRKIGRFSGMRLLYLLKNKQKDIHSIT
jgi:hypothetical protein